MGQPEDLTGAVTFLLSDAAGYITGKDPDPCVSWTAYVNLLSGTELRVDGGYTAT